jgi:hypothetical protein
MRFTDGSVLVDGGQRTAAIYLWGYAAEMTIKSAYFKCVGYAQGRRIDKASLDNAKYRARTVHRIAWPGNLHDIYSWALLLVAERSYLGRPYSTILASDFITQVSVVYRHWRETLRYHKNRAYPHEAQRVSAAVKWLLSNYGRL